MYSLVLGREGTGHFQTGVVESAANLEYEAIDRPTRPPWSFDRVSTLAFSHDAPVEVLGGLIVLSLVSAGEACKLGSERFRRE